MEFTERLLNVLEKQGDRVSVYTSFTTSSCNHTQIEDANHSEQKDSADTKAA